MNSSLYPAVISSFTQESIDASNHIVKPLLRAVTDIWYYIDITITNNAHR